MAEQRCEGERERGERERRERRAFPRDAMQRQKKGRKAATHSAKRQWTQKEEAPSLSSVAIKELRKESLYAHIELKKRDKFNFCSSDLIRPSPYEHTTQTMREWNFLFILRLLV